MGFLSLKCLFRYAAANTLHGVRVEENVIAHSDSQRDCYLAYEVEHVIHKQPSKKDGLKI